MKKTLTAGAAAFVFAAMPIVGVFAANPAAITDTLTVNVNLSCTFTRTTGTGTYSKTMLANAYDDAFGTSTFTSKCNNGTGYTITPTFTSLTFTNATMPITYSTTAPSAGSGTWAAFYGSSTTPLTSGTALVTRNSQDPAAGSTYTVTYKVGLKNNQPKGTYTGKATYQLAMAS